MLIVCLDSIQQKAQINILLQINKEHLF